MAKTKLQERTVGDVSAFLGRIMIEGGTMSSVGDPSSASTKTVCKNRGLATVEGIGRGSKWTITEAGKEFLAETSKAA